MELSCVSGAGRPALPLSRAVLAMAWTFAPALAVDQQSGEGGLAGLQLGGALGHALL